MENKKFVIIDGNAIIHRAYHALPPMTVKGTMVNAVYGFTSMLLKVIADLKPDYLAVSFDVGGGTFRDKISKDYKATRVKADQELYDQIPLCYDIVKAFDIPIYIKKGFEADDVIGTITNKIQDTRYKIQKIIVTGDKDLLQVVDDNTQVFTPKKGLSETVLYDKEEVKKKYGFGPEHIVDYKALRGDTSDNIPGVPGIGEKTATELIQKVGGIDEIYKKIEKLKDLKISENVIKKLKEGKKSAEMSYELATIVRDVPDLDFKLAECEVKQFDIVKISDLLKKFEFWSLIKRLPGAKSDENSKKQDTNKSKITNQKTKINIIEIDDKNLKDFLKEIEQVDIFACKEILSGTNVMESELLGLIFATEKNTYYIEKKYLTDTTQIFSDNKKTLIGHDLKSLLKSLLKFQISNFPDKVRDPAFHRDKFQIFDIMIASYVINSSTRSHDLKNIVMRELGKDLSIGSNQTSLFGVDKEKIAEELGYCLELYPKMKKQLAEIDNQGLFEKIEMKLIPVLAEMEFNGVAVDTVVLKKLSHDVNQELEKITKKIWKEAGQEFNVASPLQLREILFTKLKIPTDTIKKGKTGLSTAESELEKLLEEHPIIPMILEHRELAKLQNTYVDVLPTLINKTTGRIHTTYNQAVTTTGRLSSSDPNLQNIPIRTELGKEVRDTFISEKGYSLIVADYSQIELRIVASLANDEKMIEIFAEGKDIHQATAAAINNVPLDKVTKEMRYAAKEVNFGVLYGMGAYGLSWRTKIPQWQAKEFIAKYFSEFAGVKKYIEQTLQFAKKEGYVETLFGRRRYIPELNADNFQLRNSGERMAINMPIQGTAADLMKLAMINTLDKIHGEKYKKNDVKMILQVHDELVLEVKEGLEDEVSKIVKEAMENVVKLRVPVEVHISVGKRWGELK